MELGTPTTTGFATWAKPDLLRTQLPEPAARPVQWPPVRPPSAVLRLPAAPRRGLRLRRRLTRRRERGQAAPAGRTPGRVRAHRSPSRTLAAGSPSAAGRGTVRHGQLVLRRWSRLPGRRRAIRCRAVAPLGRDLSAQQPAVSTARRVPLVACQPPRRGPTAPSGQGEPASSETAGPARCQPVPLLGGASGRTDSGAPTPARRSARAMGQRWPLPRR